MKKLTKAFLLLVVSVIMMTSTFAGITASAEISVPTVTTGDGRIYLAVGVLAVAVVIVVLMMIFKKRSDD